jgi:hypothetical protein
MNSEDYAYYTDDGQNQSTYVVIDFYGQSISSIGLTLEGAIRMATLINTDRIRQEYPWPCSD